MSNAIILLHLILSFLHCLHSQYVFSLLPVENNAPLPITQFNFTEQNIIFYSKNISALNQTYIILPYTLTQGSFINKKEENCEIVDLDDSLTTPYYTITSTCHINWTMTDINSQNLTFKISSNINSRMLNSRTAFNGVIGLNYPSFNDKSDKPSTQKKNYLLDSIFSKNESLKKFDRNLVMLDYVNNEFTIGYKNESNIINKFHKCTTESTIYQYSCLVDYIILGNEIDIYLAKSLEKITLIFDNLSYYSIFPLEQLDYFLQEFFSSNDKCVSKAIDGNSTIFYIKCSKKQLSISTIKKNINFIIEGYTYQYSGLFNTDFYFNDVNGFKIEKEDDDIFFNILFRGNTTNEWLIGANFLQNKTIAYDYDDHTLYLYYNESVDMTKYFMNSQKNKETNSIDIVSSWLFILTSVVFLLFLFIVFIVHEKGKREMNREIIEMLK